MSKKQKKVLLSLVATGLMLLGALVLVRARSRSATVNRDATPAAASASAGRKEASLETQASLVGSSKLTQGALAPRRAASFVRFTLYDAGIYPRQARVNTGLVSITIEDLSGGTPGLVVGRVSSNVHVPIGVVRRIQNHSRGREEMQLQPGNYELHMADRPNNSAVLIVEP